MAFDDELGEREYTHADLSDQIGELRGFIEHRLEGLAQVERVCTDEVNDQRERCRASYVRMTLLGTIKHTVLTLVVCSTVYGCVQILANAFGHR